MPRSWIASPVESNRVTSSARRPPGSVPPKDGAELGHLVAGEDAGGDGSGELAALRRLLPLVAEDPATAERVESTPRPCRARPRRGPRGAARAQVGGPDHGIGARGDGDDDVLRGRLLAGAGPPAELRSKRLGRLGPGVGADPRAIADRGQAARRPGSVDAAADDADALGAVSRASACAETAAAAPVRSEVTEAHSISATSSPVSAFETTSTPATTGSPRAGFPGKEVTHLRIASPAPRAGIARKSPSGGASTYTFAGITHSPAAWRSNASRVRSTASAGPTAAKTASASKTGTSLTGSRLGV